MREQNGRPRKMHDAQLSDSDEQHWLELEQLENERREPILPIGRETYALPIDPNIKIYPGGRGRAYLLRKLKMPRLDPEHLASYARGIEYNALRELALGPEEEE